MQMKISEVERRVIAWYRELIGERVFGNMLREFDRKDVIHEALRLYGESDEYRKYQEELDNSPWNEQLMGG